MKKSKIMLWILFFAVNVFFINTIKLEITLQEVLIIHTFLFSLAVLTELTQKKLSTPPFFFSHLLSINFLRILACIIFLFPRMSNYEKLDDNYIYNFFICYFFHLFYEIFSKTKTLKNKQELFY